MDKLIDLTGIETTSTWWKILILGAVLSVADLHSQLLGKNIFSENSLDYLSNYFFGLCATFVTISLAVIFISGVAYFLTLLVSFVLLQLLLLSNSLIIKRRVYRTKYSMVELRRMADRIGYDGRLYQFKISEEELISMKRSPTWLFFVIAFISFEMLKFPILGSDARLLIVSFLTSFETPPGISDGLNSLEIASIDVVFYLTAIILIIRIGNDLNANASAIAMEAGSLIPLFEIESAHREAEIEEIKRIEFAIERYRRSP